MYRDERKVVIEGFKDYIVAEKNGRLLICRLRNEQMIKEWGRSGFSCFLINLKIITLDIHFLFEGGDEWLG